MKLLQICDCIIFCISNTFLLVMLDIPSTGATLASILLSIFHYYWCSEIDKLIESKDKYHLVVTLIFTTMGALVAFFSPKLVASAALISNSSSMVKSFTFTPIYLLINCFGNLMLFVAFYDVINLIIRAKGDKNR